MSCLQCKNDSPDAIKFRLLEVHTLHIRDFDGEKIIQALGEFQDYEICTACALRGARVFLYPAKLILRKCFPFVILLLAGMILSLLLTVNDSWPGLEGIFAVKAIGPLSVVVGLSGIFANVREILRVRESVSKMNHDEALRFSAYSLVLKNAPKKYQDNDITYIPVSKESQNMTPSQLAEKYNLLSAIAVKAHKLIQEEKIYE
ncbi:MAG: hypothetical protein IKQ95_09190 [Synergistaceae bacterium]|nr:hypothetical protein [Synergistaceae bacterium]